MKTALKTVSIYIAVSIILTFCTFSVFAGDPAAAGMDSGVKIKFENGPGDYFQTEIAIGDGETYGTDPDISVQNSPAKANSRLGNSPPVAELRYIILNPESYVNGRISTKTQIAWLWTYNGEQFTYDPDGDAITDMYIGGIPSDSIIASLDGNIGFVTRFSTPGQYQMTYYVKDSNGAVSNLFKVLINIESDGNTRPVCVASYSPADNITTTTPVVIDWKNSYDGDAGDAIADVRGQVYKDQGYTAQDISQYLIGIDTANQNLSLQFRETGSYEVWFSVGDSHGAWSDWTSFTIEVTTSIPSMDIHVSYQETGDTAGGGIYGTYWLDYEKSIEEYALTGNSAEALILKLMTTFYPDGISNKVIGPDMTITGTCFNPDGTPMANQTVNIKAPFNLGGLGLDAVTATDANGRFSYALQSGSAYWNAIGLEIGDRAHPLSGTIGAYAHLSDAGTLFISPTVLTVTAGQAKYQENAVITTGICRYRMVGGWILYPSGWIRFSNP